MNPSSRTIARRVVLLAAVAAAVVLALALSGGASANPVGTDGYTITADVQKDTEANTTTVTYTVVSGSDKDGVKTISHVNVCADGSLDYKSFSTGGALETGGDPSTDEPGPLVKWDSTQAPGTTQTYSYTVNGLYDATLSTARVKAGLGVFDHPVDGIGAACHGTIVIDKVTDPAGDPTSFDFSAPNTSDASFGLTDASAPESISVLPGTYDVTEAAASGWDLTGLACDDGSATSTADRTAHADVSAGETVTCTFTNTKQQTPTGPGPGSPTTPGDQGGDQNVLGQRFHRGAAHIAGASGCQRRAFKVSVRGTHLSKVTFTIDGKRVGKVSKSAGGKTYSVSVDPRRFKPGSHVVTAKVKFDKGSRPASKTLRSRFARCVRVTAPAFTG